MCCTRLADAKKGTKNRHLGTIAQLCRAISSQPRHVSEKNLLSSDNSSVIWSTSPRTVSTAFLHGTPVVGVSQTLRRWTEGTTCIRQGDHRVGHSSLVSFREVVCHVCNDGTLWPNGWMDHVLHVLNRWNATKCKFRSRNHSIVTLKLFKVWPCRIVVKRYLLHDVRHCKNPVTPVSARKRALPPPSGANAGEGCRFV